MAGDPLLLIDGNSLTYRAFFALPTDLATASGQVTNAVFGFTSMLINLMRDHGHRRMAVAIDRPEPTFRPEKLESDKANRYAAPDILRQQLGLVREVVYDSLSVRTQRESHARVGRLLASRFFAGREEPPSAIAEHLEQGGETAGAALVAHPDVDKVAFTGSTAVGKQVMRIASDTLKRVSLELGGKSPNIVLADADLDAAVSAGAWASFLHQGQICMTAGRHLVHESIADDYVAALAQHADALPVGDPAAQQVAPGPLIDAGQRGRGHGPDRAARPAAIDQAHPSRARPARGPRPSPRRRGGAGLPARGPRAPGRPGGPGARAGTADARPPAPAPTTPSRRPARPMPTQSFPK